MLELGSYKNNEEKESWKKVKTMDFISIDESEMDEGEEVLVSKPLPWQSKKSTDFKGLDVQKSRHQQKGKWSQEDKGCHHPGKKTEGDFPSSWAFKK